MQTLRFKVPGLTLRVVVEGQFTKSPFPQLAPFSIDPDGPYDHEIVLRPSESEDLPANGKLVWSGTLMNGAAAELRRDGDATGFRVPGQILIVDRPGPAVTVAEVVEGNPEALNGINATVLLDTAFRRHGLLAAHAATLLTRDGSGVVLLFAPSGSGKTTTSLILALGGYGHFGDDVAFLRKTAEGVKAWGLPRVLKVHRKTAAMLPALSPYLGEFNEEDEARLTPADLAKLAHSPPHDEYPVKALVFVGKRGSGRAVLSAVPKSQILSQILADNIGALDDGVPEHFQAFFALLSGLVTKLPAFQLDAGDDWTSVVGAFDAALAG